MVNESDYMALETELTRLRAELADMKLSLTYSENSRRDEVAVLSEQLNDYIDRCKALEAEIQEVDSVLARRPALADCKTRREMVELACVTAGKATDRIFQLKAELEECKQRKGKAVAYRAVTEAENTRLKAEMRGMVSIRAMCKHYERLEMHYRGMGMGHQAAMDAAILRTFKTVAYLASRASRKENGV
jgi:chromosome segregation ATPase